MSLDRTLDRVERTLDYALDSRYGAAAVTLTWSAPADANAPALTGYKIYKSTDGGTSYSLLDTVGAVLTADVDAVAGDRIYVAAYNDAGENPKDAAAAATLGEVITIT